MLIFTTQHFIVRQFITTDSEAFYLLNSNEAVMRYIRPVKDRAACEVFLAQQLGEYVDTPKLGRWYVGEKVTDQLIGMFSILPMQGNIDYHIGYALLPDEWGKGYATELLQAGVAYFFNNFDKQQLFAITQPENVASEKVLAKVGFALKDTTKNEHETLNLFAIKRS
ncbi:GNAT family N-acetyltransferase [Parasediminibacterium paludis]|uniref:GNAT family N-acetyltransferase n=1 Tax=Parasediminibacterium paludis TaxID=908966 RepID=A0ABV8PVI4_9BACT